jgi:copper(I)-binding protein
MKKLFVAGMLAMGGLSLAYAHTGEILQLAQADAVSGMPGHMMSAGQDAAAVHMMNRDAHQARTSDKLSETLAVSDCWIRSLPQPAPAGGYFVVHNRGAQDVRLQGASSPSYGMIMLHQTTQHGNMSKMSEVHDIVIPARGKLEFKPGGYHAMLEQLGASPAIGSEVPMEYYFDNGEKAVADCMIKAPSARSK